MPPKSSKPLTDRQHAVMVRIDRRVPIKVIAQDLGVSETRINQHIRALKDIYDAGSLGDLVEKYRATLPDPMSDPREAQAEDGRGEANSAIPLPNSEDVTKIPEVAGLSEPAYSKNQVPIPAEVSESFLRDDRGNLTINDVMPMVEQAPWLRPGEPKVVPGVLDGEHAALFRFGAIIVIAFGFLAAVVLMATAAITISEALDGKASISVDTQGQA
ncbi:hypothetical protein AUC45_11910 [Erythrobacter sp. YT30]|nr:hypothetical protein AUC45_11910 [Erythrobacter sp. YT30]